MVQIKVMLTAAFKEAYLELVPAFERATRKQRDFGCVSSVDMMTRRKGMEPV